MCATKDKASQNINLDNFPCTKFINHTLVVITQKKVSFTLRTLSPLTSIFALLKEKTNFNNNFSKSLKSNCRKKNLCKFYIILILICKLFIER